VSEKEKEKTKKKKITFLKKKKNFEKRILKMKKFF
jgi:hypothetical protein